MATATLVNQEIEEGQRLIDALKVNGVSVHSALWLYATETGNMASDVCFTSL